jgi:hypothetical protein
MVVGGQPKQATDCVPVCEKMMLMSKADDFERHAKPWGGQPSQARGRTAMGSRGVRRKGFTSVVARRDDEVITATWIDEVAIGPIGSHATREANTTIKNASVARQLLEAPRK